MNKVLVDIDGREYCLTGDKSESEIKEIAKYVDKEIQKMDNHNNRLNRFQAAVLASVNITELLFDSFDSNKKLSSDVRELKEKLAAAEAMVQEYQERAENIQKKYKNK